MIYLGESHGIDVTLDLDMLACPGYIYQLSKNWIGFG